MNELLYLALKSTIDKICYDLATALATDAIDLDDLDTADDKLNSTAPGILWQLMTVDEAPVDPMYEIIFMIGAKTSQDPGSYKLIEFTAELNQSLYRGAEIIVRDYSGASEGPIEARLLVSSVSLAPQQFDATSGVRMMAIECKGLRVS